MSVKLLKQAPWGEFFKNTFFNHQTPKKNGVLKLQYEHENNWHSGLKDSQIKEILKKVYFLYKINFSIVFKVNQLIYQNSLQDFKVLIER